jgi:hypothetical protein
VAVQLFRAATGGRPYGRDDSRDWPKQRSRPEIGLISWFGFVKIQDQGVANPVSLSRGVLRARHRDNGNADIGFFTASSTINDFTIIFLIFMQDSGISHDQLNNFSKAILIAGDMY